jgi:hypothetical protein
MFDPVVSDNMNNIRRLRCVNGLAKQLKRLGFNTEVDQDALKATINSNIVNVLKTVKPDEFHNVLPYLARVVKSS